MEKENMNAKLMTMGAVAGLAMMGTACAGTVTVNGSTTVLPAMQQVAEAFMAAHKDLNFLAAATLKSSDGTFLS